MENTKQSLFRTIFGMMINPSGTVKNALLSTKWYFSVVISALAFGLFFVQTGLDLYKTGQKGLDFVWLSGAVGVFYGLLTIPLIGFFIWIMLKLSRSNRNIKETVSSFCLSYSGALVCVSHDRRFLVDTCRDIYEMGPEGLDEKSPD